MANLVTATVDALVILGDYSKQITCINTYCIPPEVHLGLKEFLENLDNYKASNHRLDCDQYPIYLYEVVDGIKFFTVANVEDFHAAK